MAKSKKPSVVAGTLRKSLRKISAALPFGMLLAEQQAHAADEAVAEKVDIKEVALGGMAPTGQEAAAPQSADVDVSQVADAGGAVADGVNYADGSFDMSGIGATPTESFDLASMELANNFDFGNQGFFQQAAASGAATGAATTNATAAAAEATSAAASSAAGAAAGGLGDIAVSSGLGAISGTTLVAAAAVGTVAVASASHSNNSNSNGTHVATSVTSVAALGVSDTASTVTDFTHTNINFEDATFTDANHPVFDVSLLTTLNVHDASQFAEAIKLDLAGMNAATINLDNAANAGVPAILSDAMFANVANSSGVITPTAIAGAGLHNVNVASKASVTVSDDLASALHDANMLHAVADANVVVDATANVKPVLNTTLKAMADLGVDKVNTNAGHVTYVDLGVNNASQADLTKILTDLTAGHTDSSAIFANGAGLVVDQASFAAIQSSPAFLAELQKIGITEVDVVNTADFSQATKYEITAQTVDLSHTTPVQILGTDADYLHDAYAHVVTPHK